VPRALGRRQLPAGTRDALLGELLVDLASIDVLRARERGAARFKPLETFEEMADTPERAEELRAIYGDVERVGSMLGMYAEKKPKGFGFSDTAFRIFVLMASRRLKSDRFFTHDFTPRTYTPEGIRWIADNDMTSVLTRHYPELSPALRGVPNPFAPWSVGPNTGR
jgi:hypothetical protein